MRLTQSYVEGRGGFKGGVQGGGATPCQNQGGAGHPPDLYIQRLLLHIDKKGRVQGLGHTKDNLMIICFISALFLRWRFYDVVFFMAFSETHQNFHWGGGNFFYLSSI